MNNMTRTSRLTLLASLIAATTFTAACSSQQVKPASAQVSSIESSHIDATPTPQDTATNDIPTTPLMTDVNPVAAEHMLQEPLDAITVDTSSETSETALETDAARPARLVFHFGFNQSELDEENRLIVEQHGQFLAEHPEIKLVINGHSDTQGDSRYNDVLAQKRAEHVANLLMAQGVMKEQIEILSWGSSAPLADAQHHREQRRVELNYVDEYLVQSSAE